MDLKLFGQIGMTENESKVYMAILDLGKAQAGQITEKSGIHRRNVYDSISRLIEKGLVSFVTINNKKMFGAVNPKRFLEIIDEKKFELDGVKEKFRKSLPELELRAELKEKHEVRFYKGIEGLKSVYDDILRTKKSYLGFGPGQDLEKILKHYFVYFLKMRNKKKIRARVIYGEDARGMLRKRSLSELRFIPKEYSSHAALRIYGDKVAILLLSQKEPHAIVIKNAEISEGYSKYFEIMWSMAKP
jgi:sugar-specific transcriptional regulator TrmB